MVIFITGATHAGKTALAQKLLEAHHIPYLSLDHLKMGLVRSGYTTLTPTSTDAELTAYLWPIVREMVKTAIENEQSLIVEGCYIPFDYAEDFAPEYLAHIRFYALILSRGYIEKHFDDIVAFADVVEKRLDKTVSREALIGENEQLLTLAKKNAVNYILIEEEYKLPPILQDL